MFEEILAFIGLIRDQRLAPNEVWPCLHGLLVAQDHWDHNRLYHSNVQRSWKERLEASLCGFLIHLFVHESRGREYDRLFVLFLLLPLGEWDALVVVDGEEFVLVKETVDLLQSFKAVCDGHL